MRSPRRRRLRKGCRPSRRSRSSYGSRLKPFTSLEANRWISSKQSASATRRGEQACVAYSRRGHRIDPMPPIEHFICDLMQYTARKHENSKRRRARRSRSRNTTGSTRGVRGGRTNRCGQIPRGVARFFMTFLLLLLPHSFFSGLEGEEDKKVPSLPPSPDTFAVANRRG